MPNSDFIKSVNAYKEVVAAFPLPTVALGTGSTLYMSPS